MKKTLNVTTTFEEETRLKGVFLLTRKIRENNKTKTIPIGIRVPEGTIIYRVEARYRDGLVVCKSDDTVHSLDRDGSKTLLSYKESVYSIHDDGSVCLEKGSNKVSRKIARMKRYNSSASALLQDLKDLDARVRCAVYGGTFIDVKGHLLSAYCNETYEILLRYGNINKEGKIIKTKVDPKMMEGRDNYLDTIKKRLAEVLA